MLGNNIVVESAPKGRFKEGIVVGTPKPGTLMSLKTGVAAVNGAHQWEPLGTSTPLGDGDPAALIAVLCMEGPHSLHGKYWDDAFVTGDRGMLYFPLPGEELNVRRADVAGTGSPGEAVNVGTELYAIGDGSGTLAPVAVGVLAAGGVKRFVSLEQIATPGVTAGGITLAPEENLVWCMFKG
jgi:hypothetical protein